MSALTDFFRRVGPQGKPGPRGPRGQQGTAGACECKATLDRINACLEDLNKRVIMWETLARGMQTSSAHASIEAIESTLDSWQELLLANGKKLPRYTRHTLTLSKGAANEEPPSLDRCDPPA